MKLDKIIKKKLRVRNKLKRSNKNNRLSEKEKKEVYKTLSRRTK